MEGPHDFALSCPLPLQRYPAVTLSHGAGGRLMQELIAELFVKTFDNPALNAGHDGAILQMGSSRLAFTTDSYVVQPLFFPGGDIGLLAVYGTVNDLAMCGARPLYLSVGLILEEGFPMEALWRVVCSMREAADRTGVSLVTGDTKVVERGKGDGVFVNTAGVGVIEGGLDVRPQAVQQGDVLLVNGDIGRHGIAIMATREGLEFETAIVSDLAPLSGLVLELLDAGLEIHCMRDLTRGGLASALNEIAQTAGVGITIEEARISVQEEVRAACELLGFDPLYVANEGRFVAFVAARDAGRALEIMRAHPLGHGADAIGGVTSRSPARVSLKTALGVTRVVDMLTGDQLPRIC